jgi:hypothetical protein
VLGRRRCSASCAVEVLQEFVGCQFNVLVAPLGRPELTGDQAYAMDAAEVPVDEAISRLGLVGRTVGESEVPFSIFIPGMRSQEDVLVLGARLTLTPVAIEDVLASVYEAPRSLNGLRVDGVRGHVLIITDQESMSCDGITALAGKDEIHVLEVL